MTTTTPSGYDVHGLPIYEGDELDERYQAIVDKLADGLTIDCGVGSLLHGSGNVALRREFVAILHELVEREIEREASPSLLSEADGVDLWRANAVDDLRVREYEPVRARLDWPADPNLLDEDQLATAHLILKHPHLLDPIAEDLGAGGDL